MFTLETIALAAGPTVAIRKDGRLIPLAAAGARLGVPVSDVSLFQLLDTWDDSWAAIQKIVAQVEEADFVDSSALPLPQFGHAKKVICAGANYYKHLAEMDVRFVKDGTKAPFFFQKPPTALVGPGRTVPVDPSIKMLDWEVEMAIIIGRAGRDIPVSEALQHVAGYTVAIDLTARDRLMQPESIFKFDFFAGKGQDGFCPTASSFLPAAFLPDPQSTRLRLAVNGVTKQDASTSDMIYSVAELIAWSSKLATLEPGDVVLTGSPEGVGFPRREFLNIGDTIRSELDPLVSFDCQLFAKGARA